MNFYIMARNASGEIFWETSPFPEKIADYINDLKAKGFDDDDITIIAVDDTAPMTPAEFTKIWS